jgi:murein L,D-transpeptidase YcbB/YkuD
MLRDFCKTVVFLLFVAAPVCADQASEVTALLDHETGAHIEALLEHTASAPLVTDAARPLLHEQLFTLYRQRGFLPIWIDGGQLKPEAETLMETLRNAGAHGLCGDDYQLAELEGLLRIQADFAVRNLPSASDKRAILDLFLSQAFLMYATQMVEGQVDPSLAHVDWRARRRKADLVKLLEYAMLNHRLPQVLEDLVPPHEEYRQLVAALRHYRELAAYGGWPQIPAGPTIRPDARDERLPLVKALLLLTGDLALAVAMDDAYDPGTVEAVKIFQARHGLNADGVIGPKTLASFNVPVEERIRQIELNLERWRWMPKGFGRRHIRVNVADFSLDVVEDGQLVMHMPVIVGTQYRKTPVFSAQMTYLEFAPYWIVPPTILREDKLPHIKSNPAYLEEKHFHIISMNGQTMINPYEIDWAKITASNFPGLLRMDPGPWNPLGHVKFMFPNRFNIYLHDTNEAYLFDKNVRSFSSGCIRIERPLDLANYLLEKELGREKVLALFNATKTVKVPVEPMPVHIQYWTAWVGRDGRVNFRPDVYYRDLDLEVALSEPAYRVLDQLETAPAHE